MAARTRQRHLVVDGYNVLGKGTAILHGKPLDSARDQLIRDLHDYAGYSGQLVTLVFDAWQSDRLQRTEERIGALTVIYTKRGETADQYIERWCDERAADMDLQRIEVRVATSDSVEQTLVLGRGAARMSSRELLSEVFQMRQAGRSGGKNEPVKKATVMDGLPADVRERLERMRRGG